MDPYAQRCKLQTCAVNTLLHGRVPIGHITLETEEARIESQHSTAQHNTCHRL
jgi:hypothetical protein